MAASCGCAITISPAQRQAVAPSQGIAAISWANRPKLCFRQALRQRDLQSTGTHELDIGGQGSVANAMAKPMANVIREAYGNRRRTGCMNGPQTNGQIESLGLMVDGRIHDLAAQYQATSS
jgi:hypothetical protein